jgi:hypothetical protein
MISIGPTLASYEIVALLGKGGNSRNHSGIRRRHAQHRW